MSKNSRRKQNFVSPPSPTGDAPVLSKEEVRSKIASGHFVEKPKDNAKSSPVWDQFSTIEDSTNGEYAGYVICKKCCFLYKFKKGASSATLKRHICADKKKTEEEKNMDIRKQLTEKIVFMCGRDLRPFNIVSGDGFKDVLQSCIDIGATKGKVDVNDVLPHPTTISRRVENIADNIKHKMLPEIKMALSEKCCAFEVDMWSDRFVKTHYLGITSQYIDKDWKLHSNVITTAEFPGDEKKDGINIRAEIEVEMAALNISPSELKKGTFVTDQGSNIKAALKNYNRLACAGHNNATILRHTLDDEFLTQEAPNVSISLRTCRDVTTHLKRTGLCKLLSKTVKNMVEVRWNTVADMLDAFISVFEEIVELLTKRGQLHRLDGWDGQITCMSELLEFLHFFKETTEEFQAKKVPTSHLILIRYHDLLRHCSPTSEQEDTLNPEIIRIMSRAHKFTTEKFIINQEHDAAAFLCPNVRSLKNLVPEEQEKVLDAVRKIHQNLEDNCKDNSESVEDRFSSSSGDEVHPLPSKRRRFEGWEGENSNGETKADIDSEIEFYKKVGKPTSEDPRDLLPWWKNRETIFPNLARVARSVLSIPASSASVERNFSRAGLILTEKRSRLSPSVVNDLLTLVHNFFLNNPSESAPTGEITMTAVSTTNADEGSNDI